MQPRTSELLGALSSMMNLWQQPGHKTLGHSEPPTERKSSQGVEWKSSIACLLPRQVKSSQTQAEGTTLEVKQPVELIAHFKHSFCFVNLSSTMAVSTRVPPRT